jgi:glycerol-3-phosphate dehydrogenase
MTRNISTELLVIGAGATGLGIAWDASLRGIKTLVVDQSDLGEGTSGRFHGLLHSGGRYVVSDPDTAVECAHENRVLRQVASHAIEETGGYFIQAPSDPADYVESWQGAVQRLGMPYSEVTAEAVLAREPNLTPHIIRAFETQDASIDSFALLHDLKHSIEHAGGVVQLHARVQGLLKKADRVVGAQVYSEKDDSITTIGARMLINASGPWASSVARLAGIELPLALGKGTLLAMANRLVHRVINRCREPGDGDIIVPVGTVCILGTTDIPVDNPGALTPQPWEIDLLLAEAENLIPDIGGHRALRVWCGIRPMPQVSPEAETTRGMRRAHAVIDHEQADGVAGLISVVGGKLTTFRLMAQQAVDLVSEKISVSKSCQTGDTPLQTRGEARFFQLASRLGRLAPGEPVRDAPRLICECELTSRDDIRSALADAPVAALDDVRRDTRLGMGPCQGAFCTLRATGVIPDEARASTALQFYRRFVDERWRGARSLDWGYSLRQIELNRRIALELLSAHLDPERA